jgi:glycosyltransferase involved in cell wall biosynthesis
VSIDGTERPSDLKYTEGFIGMADDRQTISNEQSVMSVSVVIPTYRRSATLVDLVSRLVRVLDEITSHYEIIIVNDGSPDNSWDIIAELARERHCVHGINLMRNYGQHNALLSGIRAVQYETIVTMDDELQHPPEEIYILLDKLSEGYDVVYGTPSQEQHGIWRDLASQVTKFALQSATGSATARQASAFRVFRTQIRDAFVNYQSPFVSLDVLLTWGTTRFAAVPVRHEPRRVGKSSYTLRMLITHALNMMTGFSTLPLQFASIMGFILTLFGIGILAYVIGRYLISGGSVPGFPFLASIIAIFSGAQMFALGIIGEYIARMHFRSMERPTYTIRSKTPHHLGHH